MIEKILVTGGAGYVGSLLIPRLLDRGHKVTAYDLFIYGDYLNLLNFKHLEKKSHNIFYQTGITKSVFIHFVIYINTIVK